MDFGSICIVLKHLAGMECKESNSALFALFKNWRVAPRSRSKFSGVPECALYFRSVYPSLSTAKAMHVSDGGTLATLSETTFPRHVIYRGEIISDVEGSVRVIF